VPLVIPTSSPIIPISRKQEVVLFVGYPCLGKTSFFKQYFQSEGYLHVNQDTLKSRDKCVRAVKNALESGHSCVIGLFHSIILFDL
jgi:bifunctional polynucleotide phosphatase/kinase